MQLLSLIIPAFNEERRIGKTIANYLNTIRDIQFEIVVVDDGSRDKTAATVMEFVDRNVKLIRLDRNYGKGRAVREGLRVAEGNYLVFVDSDGATDCEALSKLIEILQSGADCVIGSRYVNGSDVVVSPLRRLTSRIFNVIVNVLFGLGIKDTQCGFKGFRAEVIKPLLPALTIDRFAFDVEILWYLKRSGALVVEMPIRWRDQAGSKVAVIRHGISMVWDLIKLRFRNGYPK